MSKLFAKVTCISGRRKSPRAGKELNREVNEDYCIYLIIQMEKLDANSVDPDQMLIIVYTASHLSVNFYREQK